MENPLAKKPLQMKPYRRKIEMTITDKHTGRTVQMSHETSIEPDFKDLKADLKTKVGLLLETLYSGLT